MARQIERVVFHAGGVVFPTLAECASAALCDSPTVAQRETLLTAVGALAAGVIDAPAFVARASDILGAQASAGEVEKRLLSAIIPLLGMPALLDEIAARVNVQLVSDYPPAWLAPALARAGLAALFPEERIIYVTKYTGYPALFGGLVDDGIIRPGQTIWVDHNSLRTSLAIRQGIDANIFVDARLLRRDLGLWGLIPRSI